VIRTSKTASPQMVTTTASRQLSGEANQSGSVDRRSRGPRLFRAMDRPVSSSRKAADHKRGGLRYGLRPQCRVAPAMFYSFSRGKKVAEVRSRMRGQFRRWELLKRIKNLRTSRPGQWRHSRLLQSNERCLVRPLSPPKAAEHKRGGLALPACKIFCLTTLLFNSSVYRWIVGAHGPTKNN
jgi:hypothetical protein